MVAYILRRIILIIPIVLGVTLVSFIILHSIPGDPAEVIAGLDGSKEILEKIRADLGLDKPLPIQYLVFIKNILIHGDFGYSYRTQRPVSQEIKGRFINSMKLGVTAIVIAILIGLICGTLSAIKENSKLDRFFTISSLISLSTPTFWSGLLLIIFFSVYLKWLPAGGMSGLKSYILPAIALGLPASAVIIRMVRTSLLEVLHENYIRTAKAKGLSPLRVILRHALKNALIPTVTVVGLQFGWLLGGTVVVETVFSWPGMGQLIITGILGRDYPMVQGAITVLAFTFILINLFVDILYTYLDPRIQYE
jgi:ABC-type dipeptide/oligopeptide/nickel transport system permease component